MHKDKRPLLAGNSPTCFLSRGREGGGGDSHIKRTGCSSYLLGVKKAVLVPLRVFSLKRSTEGALTVLFRVLHRKIMTGDT